MPLKFECVNFFLLVFLSVELSLLPKRGHCHWAK